MKNMFLVLIALFSTQSVWADGKPSPTNTLQQVQVDLDKDGQLDEVFLTLADSPDAGKDGLGLSVWVWLSSDPDAKYVEYADLATDLFNSNGTNQLMATSQGSVKVASAVDVGTRDRWSEVLTIAYRNGQVVLAGYTYQSYDSAVETEDSAETCDLNLLTGDASISKNGNVKPFKVKSTDKKIPLNEVSQDALMYRLYEPYCSQSN